MIRFLISTSEEMHNILKLEAKPRGQTLNGLIRQILWEWAESHGLMKDKDWKFLLIEKWIVSIYLLIRLRRKYER